MDVSFDHCIAEAWAASQLILEDLFENGMCLFAGYMTSIDPALLATNLSHISDISTSCDFTHSAWSNAALEDDWNRSYTLQEYVSQFQSQRILMLHADYSIPCLDYSFLIKLIFDHENNVEVIVYRENLLPRAETRDRFRAVCHHLRFLHGLFAAEALFLGPDTLDYPDWPNTVPKHWHRLL